MTKKYRVESYAAYELPDPFWMKRGEFDTAAEALRCAQNIVCGSMEGLYSANPKLDAAGLRLAYASQGEKPSIFGEPRVEFDLCRTADEHVAKIMAWAATGEWSLLTAW
jgi:hypothetical protein